jgi:hypothetical protein
MGVGNKFFEIFGKIVLILIILGAVAYGSFYLGSKNAQLPLGNQSTVSPTSASTPTVETITVAPTVDENTNIITAVRNGLIAEHGQNAASLKITVSKIQGDYALGGASEQGGGGMWLAAKVAGAWKLVWDGNGTIQCSNLAPYSNFPKDMAPECWDNISSKLIKR